MQKTLEQIKQRLRELAPDPDDYRVLAQADHVYLVTSEPDGRAIEDYVLELRQQNLFQYSWLLRGDRKGPFRIHDRNNQHDWRRGYLFTVDSEQHRAFLDNLLINFIRHGFFMEDLSIKPLEKQHRQDIFDKFFEVSSQ